MPCLDELDQQVDSLVYGDVSAITMAVPRRAREGDDGIGRRDTAAAKARHEYH
jgi:hypothetical protein